MPRTVLDAGDSIGNKARRIHIFFVLTHLLVTEGTGKKMNLS